MNLGNYEETKKIFNKVLINYVKHYGKVHTEVAGVICNLGQVYLLEGQIEIAETLIDQALKIFQKNRHPDSYMCLEILAKLYLEKSIQAMDKEDRQKSKIFKRRSTVYLNQALDIIKTHLPERSAHITRIQSKIK